MESTANKPQRKACDLCYHKKLKCDALKPRCSTCVVYGVECTHKAASRKKGGGVGRREGSGGVSGGQKGVIKGLEEQLREARKEVERLRGKDVRKVDGGGVRGDVDLVERRSGVQRKGVGVLPPYEEAVVLIEEYLSTFNVVFPLFDPREVLQTTRAVYTNNNSASDDPVSWALLNTILALATHTSSSSSTIKTSRRTQTSTHLSAAQSVLSPIITTPTPALINIQIPLALAMLFYLVADTQPAIILVATALRLAHQIGLHSRAASAHLPPRDVAQRNNVFWMAYILDRDTSMLARVPPIQQDGDIDIDLPPTTLPPSCPDSPATTGFVFSSPNTTPSTTNFFRLRILLARIQGKVYEYVYSLPATNSPPATRARNISLVLRALDEWTAQIPEAFHASNLSTTSSNANDPTARYFVILYGTALGCRGVISHASAQDSFHYSQWVGDVRAYGRAVSVSNGEVVGETQPPVEKGWVRLVQESREFMGLFERAALGVGWIEACAYFTGLICLVANAIFDAQAAYVESDQRLMDISSSLLDTMAAQKEATPKVRELRDAVQDLRSYADVISSSRCKTKSWDDEVESWLNSNDFAGFGSTINNWPFLM